MPAVLWATWRCRPIAAPMISATLRRPRILTRCVRSGSERVSSVITVFKRPPCLTALPARCARHAQFQVRWFVEVFQEQAPLFGRQGGPVHLISVSAAQLPVTDAHARATCAAPAVGQTP